MTSLFASRGNLKLRITAKDQVTIPREIREKAGLVPHTEVRFVYDGLYIRIEKMKTRIGKARVTAHLRGRGDVAMSTDEIIALIRGD